MFEIIILAAWVNVAGEWPTDLPDMTKQWFKSLRGPLGFCCDMADGHPADWDYKNGHYIVRIRDEWRDVPPETVITDKGNPTGRAVVWLTMAGDIKCFVPGHSG